jgi:hypothetical protein
MLGEAIMSILVLYLSIFHKHREKATKHFIEDSQYFGGESNPEPPEYDIRVLTSTHSDIFMWFAWEV